jgi:parallel beta-helix repeat protein
VLGFSVYLSDNRFIKKNKVKRMKSKKTRTTVLISVFIAILAINLGFAFTNLPFSKATNQTTFLEGLKISATHTYRLEIDDADPTKDWATVKAAGNCTGSGTSGDPYIISGDTFNTTSGSECLSILNSRKHFRVLNCEFIISGFSAGIWLDNTTNGLIEGNQLPRNIFLNIVANNCSQIILRDNNCSTSIAGIVVSNSEYVNLYSNIANDNLADGINLDNCESCIIEDNDIIENDDNGIYLNDCDSVTIRTNTIINNSIGINNEISNNTQILGNTITNNGNHGIRIFQSLWCEISGNTITESTNDGIRVEQSTHNLFESNTVNDNFYGIHLITSSEFNTISKNTANNNQDDGIYLDSCDFSVVDQNTANHNGDEGIWLTGCDDSVVSKCTTYNNTGNGIRVNSAENVTCIDNEVYNNLENGIRYFSTDDSKIENNNAHHNGQ